MSFRIAALAATLLLLLDVATARAQLVFGSTTTSTSNPCAFYLDVTSGVTTTLWNSVANRKVNGAATDAANSRLYTNDAARLSSWNFGSVGTAPTVIAGMYRTTDNVSFTATGVDGLTFANGQLYGSTSFASTTFKRGIYQIATTSDGMATPHCVMTPLWLDQTGTSIVLSGLDYNPADNLFYVTSTQDVISAGGNFARGIYSIDAFGSGAINKVADFPAGRTGIDGLAIGGGKFWLTEQEAANSRIDIYPYDPVTQTYGSTIFVPLTDATSRATGATWAPGALVAVPEPLTAGVLAICGTLIALKRR
jgi:hypothetical protein